RDPAGGRADRAPGEAARRRAGAHARDVGEREEGAAHDLRRVRRVHAPGQGERPGGLGGDVVRLRRLLLCFSALALVPAAHAAAPPRLSSDHAPVSIASTYGSGHFGSWAVDGFGLPAYRYSVGELKTPFAAQPELAGRNGACHQVGSATTAP